MGKNKFQVENKVEVYIKKQKKEKNNFTLFRLTFFFLFFEGLKI